MSAQDTLRTTRPKRVVVKLRIAYQRMTDEMVKQILIFQGMEGSTDYYSHIGCRDEKVYIILDLYCKTHPSLSTQISNIPYEVYDARKPGNKLYVSKLV